jgi:hypothetical protein
MNADLLANVERQPEERPARSAPLLPDLESEASHWLGSAVSEVEFWKSRALRAEAEIANQPRRPR